MVEVVSWNRVVKVPVIVTGDDAAAMVAELEALFAKKFDEA